MKSVFLMAGAAALAFSASPSLADPGKAKGKGKSHSSAHMVKAKGKSGGVIVSDRYGRLYALNARGTCPPGLAKRGNGCMPPGQAKKMYNVGQRYNRNFGQAWAYNQIPPALLGQYNLDPDDRYYYNNGYLYQVDPRTMLVQQVISALLR